MSVRRLSLTIGAAIGALALLGAACANADGGGAAAGTGSTGAGTATGTTGGAGAMGGGGGYGAGAGGYGAGGGGGRYDYGSGGGNAGSSQGMDGADATLSADNFAFAPTEIQVASGTEITVANANANTAHSFTVDGTDIDLTLDPGKTQTLQIDLDPGDYAFHCRFHASMTGTLTVT